MSKILAPSRVTTRDSKGLKFMSIVDGQYNKAALSEEEAQRVNDTPGLAELIGNFIAESRRTNVYANEEVPSNWTYPAEYTGPKPIVEQIEEIAKFFALDPSHALEFAKTLPDLSTYVPEDALPHVGWFAIPSVDAIARKFFSKVTDPTDQYCHAVNLVLQKFGDARKFQNYRAGQITPDRLRMQPRTLEAIKQIAGQQPGDILIIAAQFGLRYRGRSVRRAREVFVANEFGLGWFAVGCMTLTHPERFVRWEQLHTDCPGDDFAAAAGGRFDDVPLFHFSAGQLKSDTRWSDRANGYYGSASGFSPQ